MSHKDIASHGQTHTRSRNLMPHVLTAIKLIENPRALGFGKWVAVIPHRDRNRAFPETGCDPDRGSKWRIFERVIDKLPQSKLDQISVNKDRRQIGRYRNVNATAVTLP